MNENTPCCAHSTVLLGRVHNSNGTCSDFWQCSDCRQQFFPSTQNRADDIQMRRDRFDRYMQAALTGIAAIYESDSCSDTLPAERAFSLASAAQDKADAAEMAEAPRTFEEALKTPTNNPPFARPITPDDLVKEADRNYDLGRKHGHEEKAELLDWAEALLCNSLPPSHCTPEEWNDVIKRWRDEKHGVPAAGGSYQSPPSKTFFRHLNDDPDRFGRVLWVLLDKAFPEGTHIPVESLKAMPGDWGVKFRDESASGTVMIKATTFGSLDASIPSAKATPSPTQNFEALKYDHDRFAKILWVIVRNDYERDGHLTHVLNRDIASVPSDWRLKVEEGDGVTQPPYIILLAERSSNDGKEKE